MRLGIYVYWFIVYVCVCVLVWIMEARRNGEGVGDGVKIKTFGIFLCVLLYLLYNVAIFFLVCTRKSINELYVFVCAYVCV